MNTRTNSEAVTGNVYFSIQEYFNSSILFRRTWDAKILYNAHKNIIQNTSFTDYHAHSIFH